MLPQAQGPAAYLSDEVSFALPMFPKYHVHSSQTADAQVLSKP